MSGQNINAATKRDLNGDVAIQKTVLTLYCKDNPSKRFIDAVLFLYLKQDPLKDGSRK